MAFEMFQVQICLVAVRTFVLALCILSGIGGRFSCSGRRSAGMRGQDTASSLLSDNVQWLRLLVRKDRRMRV